MTARMLGIGHAVAGVREGEPELTELKREKEGIDGK